MIIFYALGGHLIWPSLCHIKWPPTVSSLDGDCSIFFKSLLNTITQVFPEWRLFLAESVDDAELNNLILVASFEGLDSPGYIKEFPEYKDKVDLDSAFVLTDNYAPVEILSSALMNELY